MARYRTTIILLAIVVILGGAIILLNLNGGTASDAGGTPTPVPQYMWQETEGVSSIDVVSGTAHVTVQEDMSTTVWSLVAPIKADADSFAVPSAADSLKNLEATQVVTSSADLAQYGLDTPGLTIAVGFGGSTTPKHTLVVGKATIDGAGYYANEQNSKAVYIVNNTIIEPLKSWLTTPPKAQPTATPLPLTLVPTPSASEVVTGTQTVTATQTVSLSVPATTTTTLTGSATITSTSPGAANPTTPLPATPAATPTK